MINEIGKAVYNYTQWSLAAIAAELFKPEILKIAGIANENAKKVRKISECKKTDLESKMVQPAVKYSLSPVGMPKKVNSDYDYREAIDSYKKQQNSKPAKGKIDVLI